MINFSLKVNSKGPFTDLADLFSNKPLSKQKLENKNIQLVFWGDPIPSKKILNCIQDNENITVKNVVKEVAGHYYFMLYDKTKVDLFIGNSLFSILPVYYHLHKDGILLSDNPMNALPKGKDPVMNKRFILENVLFNYNLFDQSYLTDVQLLPSNSFIAVTGNSIEIKKHTHIEELFVKDPKPWRSSVEETSSTFIRMSEKYFPEEKYVTALTGGFDGRTLTACGLYFKRQFSTFSFGNEASSDVNIPRKISEIIGVKYKTIKLNSEYIEKKSLRNGLEFITNSSGTGGFPRAHYLYAAKDLSKETKYLITGNFGSEIFRAMHNEGPVLNANTLSLFHAVTFKDGIKAIESSKEFRSLNIQSFNKEWEDLKKDIQTFPCFNPKYSSLSKNKQFYIFVFEELFRKYFGSEMVNQYAYIINRTPFLDLEFITQILKTELAGVYSDFFTHNPAKRFKGQILYAHIIKKSYPKLNKELTDKGYKPGDLISLFGKFNITASFLRKKLVWAENKDPDPYAVKRSFDWNFDFWKKVKIDQVLFNRSAIESELAKRKHSNPLAIILSQIWWQNKALKKHEV